MHVTRRRTHIAAFIFAVAAPAPAFAYMGPGIGLGALGAALGVVASLLLVLISVIWYPLKRLSRRMRGRTPRHRAASFIPREGGGEDQ
jgi:hypothetical protein